MTTNITAAHRRAFDIAVPTQCRDLIERIGHTLSPSRIPLPELTGVPVDPAASSVRRCERVGLSAMRPG